MTRLYPDCNEPHKPSTTQLLATGTIRQCLDAAHKLDELMGMPGSSPLWVERAAALRERARELDEEMKQRKPRRRVHLKLTPRQAEAVYDALLDPTWARGRRTHLCRAVEAKLERSFDALFVDWRGGDWSWKTKEGE